FECEEMRVDAAASDGVTARLRNRRGTAAGEERSGEQHRAADFFRERDVGERTDVALRRDAYDILLEVLDGSAEAFEDLQHDANVLDVRQIAEDDRLVREDACGDDR